MAFPQSGMILKTLLENPELLNPPTTEKNVGKKPTDSPPSYNNQSAFLGPNIWSNNAADGGEDFDFEYMDLEEFLTESGIAVNGELFGDLVTNSTSNSNSPRQSEVSARSPRGTSGVQSPRVASLSSPVSTGNCDVTGQPHRTQTSNYKSPLPQAFHGRPRSVSTPAPDLGHTQPTHSTLGHRDSLGPPTSIVPVDFAVKDHDLALANIPGKDDFDPRLRTFSEDELRPQPMIKKSSKIFVLDEQKDDKYWFRRNKNNVAAKRSRDARRIKENQITLRAAFLEKQSEQLQEELTAALEENKLLKERLAKYESAAP